MFYSDRDMKTLIRLTDERDRLERALSDALDAGDISQESWARKGLANLRQLATEKGFAGMI